MKAQEVTAQEMLSPARIMETGMAFMASKTLLTAITLELFTHLGEDALSGAEIGERLNLHKRSLYDFLDTLVSLRLLQREGLLSSAFYRNTKETSLFLDKKKPSYTGGILEMANDRLYPFWAHLEEGLHTGKPQNEAKYCEKSMFEAVYAQPSVLRLFLEGMGGIQLGNFMALSQSFDFENYRSLCDIGGGNGLLSICVARRHPHLQILSLDLPQVEPIARENIEKAGLSERVTLMSLDMMSSPFPKADLIFMGNILHDWNEGEKKHLIRKAYDALPRGGALIVIENIIDDERKENTFGLLISLTMLIETEGGFDFTHADFHHWAVEAGFTNTIKIPLAGPSSAVIAYK